MGKGSWLQRASRDKAIWTVWAPIQINFECAGLYFTNRTRLWLIIRFNNHPCFRSNISPVNNKSIVFLLKDGELPVLPLSVYGAVAMAHSDVSEEYSSTNQFFFYLYDKRNVGVTEHYGLTKKYYSPRVNIMHKWFSSSGWLRRAIVWWRSIFGLWVCSRLVEPSTSLPPPYPLPLFPWYIARISTLNCNIPDVTQFSRQIHNYGQRHPSSDKNRRHHTVSKARWRSRSPRLAKGASMRLLKIVLLGLLRACRVSHMRHENVHREREREGIDNVLYRFFVMEFLVLDNKHILKHYLI